MHFTLRWSCCDRNVNVNVLSILHEVNPDSAGALFPWSNSAWYVKYFLTFFMYHHCYLYAYQGSNIRQINSSRSKLFRSTQTWTIYYINLTEFQWAHTSHWSVRLGLMTSKHGSCSSVITTGGTDTLGQSLHWLFQGRTQLQSLPRCHLLPWQYAAVHHSTVSITFLWHLWFTAYT